MRQIYTSPRLENVERVAELLREAGIEARITNGRSYKGSRRAAFSYRDSGGRQPEPAVWVVKSEDQPRAREIMRGVGLLDTTRPAEGYLAPTFRPAEPEAPARSPAQQRALKIKLALLAGIAVLLALALLRAFA